MQRNYVVKVGWCCLCRKYVSQQEDVLKAHVEDVHKVKPVGVTTVNVKRVS